MTLIRREHRDDVVAIRDVTAAAFRAAEHSAPPVEPGGPPGEVNLNRPTARGRGLDPGTVTGGGDGGARRGPCGRVEGVRR